ncbi:low temperature requirement protein A [Plantactinospora sp. KBS50]|uniref:low temperature requirement protein A n=1 Tax=Plantactinospora sp. KBS50 TaxID=2024580 RepID=UPI000BAAF370|nr:low temperature requirement protein A [Plantactinospora sp. KBS50]ASW55175.1 hypothetical protein CIK06_14815 [Plantactinospora sp. KBS50]
MAADQGPGRAIQPAVQHPGVTRLELFLDLIFTYAFLNVSGIAAVKLGPSDVLHGLLLMALLWRCWAAYAWLGGTVRTDRGVVPPLVFGLATILFILAVTLPEAFVDRDGGLSGPMVFAAGYVVARAGALILLNAAHEMRSGWRRMLRTWSPLLVAGPLLFAAALLPPLLPTPVLGETVRFGLIILALLIEYAGPAMRRVESLRIRSGGYWAERHGLIIIVGVGETIISIGGSQGTAFAQPITWRVIIGMACGLVIAALLWWLYFDLARFGAEAAMERATGVARSRLARDAYTYLHFPLIAGLMLLAFGLQHTLAGFTFPGEDGSRLGPVVLYSGVLLFLAGLIGFERRTLGILGRSPILGFALVLLALPVADRVPRLAQLLLVVAAVAAMVVADRTVFRARHGELHRIADPLAAQTDGVTPKELFFDLVFVFAFVQVTTLMAGDPTTGGLFRGLAVVTMLWWGWSGYARLTHRGPPERGTLLILVVAAASVLVLTVAMSQAFSAGIGGLPGPVVFAGAYAVVRLLGMAAELFYAPWRALRHRLVVAVPTVVSVTAILVAALLPVPNGDIRTLPPARVALWLAAIAVDAVGVALRSPRHQRIRSPEHWSDRHALIIIIALGEAVISMGTAVTDTPISARIIVALACGTTLLGMLWWACFGLDVLAGERALWAYRGRRRAALARDAYTYLHLPVIIGIVLVALGLRKTLGGLGAAGLFGFGGVLDPVPHLALYGGVVVYLLAGEAIWWRSGQRIRPVRLTLAAVLGVLAPVTSDLPALLALFLLTGVVAAFLVLDTVMSREVRRELGAAGVGQRASIGRQAG